MNSAEVEVVSLGPLTPREAEALLWVAQGKTAWEAGTILGITETTTNAHIASAAAKLRASNRAHLIIRAFVEGILAPLGSVILLLIALHLTLFGTDDPRPPRTGRRREDTGYEVLIGKNDRA